MSLANEVESGLVVVKGVVPSSARNSNLCCSSPPLCSGAHPVIRANDVFECNALCVTGRDLQLLQLLQSSLHCVHSSANTRVRAVSCSHRH